MKRRKLQQQKLGPGTYNIKDFLQETRPCSLRGICDTREQRFRDTRKDCTPGPGMYGNPYAHLAERDKRSAGTRGLMDSRTPKCALPEVVGSGLGPGTYNLRSSIDEVVRRARASRPCQPSLRDRKKPAGGGRGGRDALEGRDTKRTTSTVKGFVDELMLKENKKKGCFSTLPRNPACPTERIFWATLSQCPREAYAVGPGSYDPKPVERSVCSSQPAFGSSAKRFDRKSYRLFTGNEQHQQRVTFSFQNPVGVGRYDITRKEKYPPKMQYQSLYRCDAQRYLSNLQRDTYLLERLRPVAENKWSGLISAPRCPDNSAPAVFQT
ncbi:lymphocyte expansion molecule [Apus apus]|uniref:lymphocyte expansion molecule n=1 Tax=Apus apus TaxID=8895 RepID=UPI0021F9110F|nr:lymphocyte expansion molecule [Apus apus]